MAFEDELDQTVERIIDEAIDFYMYGLGWTRHGGNYMGADGYRALVSYGEIPPGSGNRGAILAVEQDWARLPRPRLVVTGEVTGGRDVNDVVELDVVRVEPTG
jgi:hypothetical protein